MTNYVNKGIGRMWRESKPRKPRRDSKLHGLPRKQRAMVDKWLFDKGLTYQEVADACRETFGLRVSRSSVGRYYEREARGRVRNKDDKHLVEWKIRTPEENYQACLQWMTDRALAELDWPVGDERDLKLVLRFMRILLAARQERNDARLVALERRRFQLRAARETLDYVQSERETERRRAARHERETWYLGG